MCIFLYFHFITLYFYIFTYYYYFVFNFQVRVSLRSIDRPGTHIDPPVLFLFPGPHTTNPQPVYFGVRVHWQAVLPGQGAPEILWSLPDQLEGYRHELQSLACTCRGGEPRSSCLCGTHSTDGTISPGPVTIPVTVLSAGITGRPHRS